VGGEGFVMKRFVAVAAALSLWAVGGVLAQASGGGSFDYHIGDSFLVAFGFPATDVAQASNGDQIVLVGTGTFNTANGAATGVGTFQHHAADGSPIGSGTWTANRLVTFQSFGCGGGGLPSNFCGGRATLAAHIVGHLASDPSRMVEADALVDVICEVGNPPAGQIEGVRVNVKDLINFNKQVSGVTVFVAH